MKKTIAIFLSLAMVFALFGAMTVSVSAEDVVWSVFKSADNGDLLTKSAASVTVSRIDNTYSTIESSKIWHVSQTSYQATATWFTFDAGTLTDVKDIRLWASASSGGFDLILKAGSTIYGCNNLLTSDGKTYSFGSTSFYEYGTATEYNCYTTPSSTKVAFSDIDMSTVTMIQIQRRYDANVGAKSGSLYCDKIEIATASSDETIQMLSGASMRIAGDTDGLRFEASVDQTAFNEKLAGGTVTEIGTLIAKAGTDINNVVIANAADATAGSSVEVGENEIPVAKYAAETTLDDIEGTDSYVIVGSLIAIKPENKDQKYVARAYVMYKDGEGNDHVLYANSLSDARSISQVAQKIAADTDYYNSLCETHKAAVDKWLPTT